jgi:hypothetical protein
MAKQEPTRQAQRLQSSSATFAGAGGVGVDTAVIRPARTKHGPRGKWRELEFAQLAIQALQGANPSKHQDYKKLTVEVNEWLQKNPEWLSSRLGKVSKPTVERALKTVRP